MKCSLCENSSELVYAGCPGYKEGRNYDIYECTACRSSFVAPLVVDEGIYRNIYRSIDRTPGYARYNSYYVHCAQERSPLDYLCSREDTYWAVGSHLRRRRDQCGGSLSVLEVGCGLGYFTYALAAAGFNAKGIDISEAAIERATNQFGPLFFCADLYKHAFSDRNRYDAVVMNQLIEHVPDINNLIRAAAALLADGGEIIVTTPNKTSFPGMIWETELPPVHLWWLGESSFEYLARRHDMTVDFVDFTGFFQTNYSYPFIFGDITLRKSILDNAGNIISPLARERKAKRTFRLLFEKIFLSGAYRFIHDRLAGKTRWQGPRGPVCCAILKPMKVK